MSKEFRRKLSQLVGSRLASVVLYSILRALRLTLRITLVGGERINDLVQEGKGFIGVFWHSRMLMLPFLYPGQRLHVLVSAHRDGEIIANILSQFGFTLVRGSSTRRGLAAVKELVRLIRSGKDLAISPDGPRGPAEKMKPGAAEVARISGRPVLPVAYAASRYLRLNSWDRFIFPLPFSRVVAVFGEPLSPREGENGESFHQRIETALRETTTKADALAAGTGIDSQDE